jgi:hypothetical protein
MAAAAVGIAGGILNAGATGLGLNFAKNDTELSKEVFVQQMQQAKRLWGRDWACASLVEQLSSCGPGLLVITR